MFDKTTSPDWRRLAEDFTLGELIELSPGGGTAAPKAAVLTEKGRYMIRARRAISSPDEIVAFDHSVIRAVSTAGVPTPLPLPSYRGKTWIRYGSIAFEAFPFFEGLSSFQRDSQAELESAARVLALFHTATRALAPAGSKPWAREHEINTMMQTLGKALSEAEIQGAEKQAADAETMWESAQRLQVQLTDRVIHSLPSVIIHGDFTPANVMFRKQQVGGVFDFDWVSYQPRVIDIGEALQFFAFHRASDIDPNDIWSLVQAWQPDEERAALFLKAYQEMSSLSDLEAQWLPRFMRETWFGIRVRAMRKVSSSSRLKILTDGGVEPLLWLEDNEMRLREIALSTRQA